MLTQKQKELLLLIHRRVQETGVPPSFEEMKEALDLKSKSGIHRLITALEERGFIRRLPHRARALEIVKLPDAIADFTRPRHAEPHGIASPDTGSQDIGSHATGGANSASRSVSRVLPFQKPPRREAEPGTVPLMGRIAAGVPISAIQDHTEDISCPPDLLGSGEHFALTVSGDSMIEAGIHDGDTVIIRRTSSAETGDIVVALVEKEEATLKRLRKKGGAIALEAANPAFETRIFRADQVDVQGRLVGLIRRY